MCIFSIMSGRGCSTKSSKHSERSQRVVHDTTAKQPTCQEDFGLEKLAVRGMEGLRQYERGHFKLQPTHLFRSEVPFHRNALLSLRRRPA